MRYAYVFVLVDDRVCVLQHQDGKVRASNLANKARFEDISESFWEDFQRVFNIDPKGHKDYAFVWLNKAYKHSIVLNTPDFKDRLEDSIWNHRYMADVRDILEGDCSMRFNFEDFTGCQLYPSPSATLLFTNANLERPQETSFEDEKRSTGFHDYSKDSLKSNHEAIYGKNPKKSTSVGRTLPTKASLKGDDKPSKDEENV
ncbi:hypothetical protein NHP200010_13040 [Helicobacter bizzozeronii]|uniref:hypothetical protein n=1 Tax=Helicobacter bizzozeronii TaxID=56877 RepID=UPI00244D950F|nr:hypothetical protein [Helicobacter bizzozeronii]GMB93582.1 hypothetical protein NHP200010_13040 [Helicobacter bizzozeronii]